MATPCISKCCKAPALVKGDDGEGTFWNHCTGCQKPCDLLVLKKKQTYISSKREMRLRLLMTISSSMLILFSGIILGLAFGTARFQHVCAEAQVDVITGNYQTK